MSYKLCKRASVHTASKIGDMLDLLLGSALSFAIKALVF